jgi:1-acyl-sn-glycerol-3-phosphate acyltransferase
MGLRRAVVIRLIRFVMFAFCKIDAGEYSAAVRGGRLSDGTPVKPMIIAVNHINFLDVPILASQAYPRLVVGILKDTTWKNPFMSFLCGTFDAIPLNRGGAFLDTFKRAKEAVDNGAFIGIAPEGSRSGTGILQKGRAGVLALALMTKTPILPVAHYGEQHFWKNIRRFKRTTVVYKVGRPFYFKTKDGTVPRAEREKYIDEMMIQIAALLPEELRGAYAGRVSEKCERLEFL